MNEDCLLGGGEAVQQLAGEDVLLEGVGVVLLGKVQHGQLINLAGRLDLQAADEARQLRLVVTDASRQCEPREHAARHLEFRPAALGRAKIAQERVAAGQ